jgi:hypothetical protein
MEDRIEPEFEHVLDQPFSHIQETSIPIEHVSNPLPIGTELVQSIQPTPIYIFPETSITYAQHESLKHVTFFFG